MILQCPQCKSQFKPMKFSKAPDGSDLIECLTCNFVFKAPSSLQPQENASDDAVHVPPEKTRDPESRPGGIEFVEVETRPAHGAGTAEQDKLSEPLAESAPSADKISAAPSAQPETPGKHDASDASAADVAHQPDAASLKKIMIVDDTSFFRMVLSDLFKENGYDTVTAVDGAEALAKLKKEHANLDLLLLDLQLPKMNGFEVLDNLHRLGIARDLPILIITGIHQKPEEVRLVKQLGATGYISKANPPEYFLYRVNKILNPSKALWNDEDNEEG